MAEDKLAQRKGNRATLIDLLRKERTAMQAVIPKHLTAERLARVAFTTINRDPKLSRCTPESLCECIMQASMLGLEPNDGTGRCYLIPFQNRGVMQATLVVGYAGLVELAYRSGQVQTIASFPVFDGDDFTWTLGLNPDIQHKPCGETKADLLTHVYAVCRLKNGGVLFEVMTRAQIEDIRKRSRSGSSGPWVSDYVEMARKTAIRRLCKMVPMSVELRQAVGTDETMEFGGFDQQAPPTVEQVEEQSSALPPAGDEAPVFCPCGAEAQVLSPDGISRCPECDAGLAQ